MSQSESNVRAFEESDTLDFFSYDEPRDSQADGMETIYETAQRDGFVLTEGACGTGKTLMALAPSLDLVRDPRTKFERVLIATSVKQQQEAFMDEVDGINDSLPTQKRPVSALTLVGLPDVHPYVRQGVVPSRKAYSEIDRLRQNTRKLVNDHNYDPSELYRDAEREGQSFQVSKSSFPYEDSVPEIGDVEFDPYYAKYLEAKRDDDDETATNPAIPFSPSRVGLLRPDDLVSQAGNVGMCPHAVMREAMDEVEVVIANYYHIFEETTAEQFTAPILDEETLVILDEAHNLVPRVRDLLGDEAAMESITKAREEIEELTVLAEVGETDMSKLQGVDVGLKEAIDSLDVDDETVELAKKMQVAVEDGHSMATNEREFMTLAERTHELFSKFEISPDEFDEWREFLGEMQDAIASLLDRKLETKYGPSWVDGGAVSDPETIPLRDPSTPQSDNLTEWANLMGNGTSLMADSEEYGELASAIRDTLHEEVLESDKTPQTRASTVGGLLTQWIEKDNTQYFRSLTIEPREYSPDGASYEYDWEEHYKLSLDINNCIPRDEIAECLDQFGAGVVMSATLEPLDVYRDVTGLDKLSADRPIVERTYGLGFPVDNRLTAGVRADPFKYNNKGSTKDQSGKPNENPVREEYRDVLVDVVTTTPGNVLISMPSYSEAWWAGTALRRHPEVDARNVMIDESSSNLQTQELKREFFESEEGVLVTGAHGTLVEGVDYEGDRLNAVVVCGVPIENTNNPISKAIRAAYEDTFGSDNGFEYAFTVPAVRKARQSLGRVIRSDEDTGIRMLLDSRYTDVDSWDNVQEYLSPGEQEEMRCLDPENVRNQLKAFWKYQDKY